MASRSLKPPPSHRVRSPQKDVFKPRFPIDPFASAKVREPWFVKQDQLPNQARRDVVLILGAPTTQDLSPLLLSKPFANSLLILASHKPPEIPHTTLPTVRLLRLTERLDIEDAGAIRFVNVLEWAERVGRVWRKHGGLGAVELSEKDDGQEYIPPPSIFRFSGSQSTPVSPRSSSSRLASDVTAPNEGSSGSPGRRRSALLTSLNRSRRSLLPTVDPTQRPFDAIVNFLPQDTSGKALLKQAILVTTISRPFLMAASNGSGGSVPPRSPSSKRRSSLFGSKSSTSVYLPPSTPYSSSGESLSALLPPPPAKAHLLHLLPRESREFSATARSKLVYSLESFLISYAYPASFDISSASSKDDAMERARPYVMQVTQISQVINAQSVSLSTSPYDSETGSYTLVDLALCGSLDGSESPNGSPNSKRPVGPFARLTPRAWIPGTTDIVLISEDAHSATVQTIMNGPNLTLTPPSPDAPSQPFPSSSTTSVPPPTLFSSHSSPPGRPPRCGYRPRLPISQATADSSLSYTPFSSSSTATSASTSPVPTSPLAHEYDKKQFANTSLSHPPLPTPPDSDESGSDTNNPHTHAQMKYGGVLGFSWTRARRRRSVSGPSMCEVSDLGSMKTKSVGRKGKWKFWKMVT